MKAMYQKCFGEKLLYEMAREKTSLLGRTKKPWQIVAGMVYHLGEELSTITVRRFFDRPFTDCTTRRACLQVIIRGSDTSVTFFEECRDSEWVHESNVDLWLRLNVKAEAWLADRYGSAASQKACQRLDVVRDATDEAVDKCLRAIVAIAQYETPETTDEALLLNDRLVAIVGRLQLLAAAAQLGERI